MMDEKRMKMAERLARKSCTGERPPQHLSALWDLGADVLALANALRESRRVGEIRERKIAELEAQVARMKPVVDAADNFVMDDVRAVPDLFNALRSALLAYEKGER